MSEKSLDDLRKDHVSPSQEPVEAPQAESEVMTEKQEPAAEPSNAELESMTKRFEDTRKAFHNGFETNRELVTLLKDNGVIDEAKASEFLNKAKSNDMSLGENPMEQIVTKFNSESAIVASALGLDEEITTKYTDGFKQYATVDPKLNEELMQVPPAQMTKWILDKGKEFLEVSPVIEKHGSVLGAVRALSNDTPDLEALKEQLREELRQEFGSTSRATKPNLNRVGGSTTSAPTQTTRSVEDLRSLYIKK